MRLTDITHPLAGAKRTFQYGYDEVGNWLSAQRTGGTADSFSDEKEKPHVGAR